MTTEQKLQANEKALSCRIVNPSATTTSVTGEGNTSFTELGKEEIESKVWV